MHVHPDGTRHVHHGATDVRGIYVTQVAFDRPRAWGIEGLVKEGNGPGAVLRLSIEVLAASRIVEEWGLRPGPWIFVVDGQGIIRAKFEGLTTAREIEMALQQLLE